MNRLRGLLLHTGVICSFVCIAAKVLDWFNPYMDFTGHIWFMQLVLYFAVILLALLKKTYRYPKCGTCHLSVKSRGAGNVVDIIPADRYNVCKGR